MNDTTAKVSQLIHCKPQEAFDAFADPAQITRFWLDAASAPLAPNARSTWRFMVPGAEDTVTVHAFEPPHRIVLSWSDGTQLRLEFAEHPSGGTRVSAAFTVSANDGIDHVVNTAEGYSIVLCDLKTLLESGRSANLVRAKAGLIAGG